MADSCANCKKTKAELAEPLKQCAKCKSITYCSRDCQKADWKKHKKVCGHGPSASSSSAGDQSIVDRLELSRIDMSLREQRYLQYFSDELGLSEVDLSKVIGVSGGRLVFGGSDFGTAVDAGSVRLVNGHTLTAKIGGAEAWIDLNERIRSVDEVLRYREGGYGGVDERCICCSWRFSK
ncbi:hypothetical protein FN846DRAFT_553197 [Sphaerosporella brunnea]|uniref:MYND-type domain-containing protein n=1 Tax=Sphaerosporella brunnea TaxID=1250544 RepID=A0A5J5F2V9_9PEZI|nr:hypothetical protein FN846DRAFT_553197 [Sphaerosporella brunnea]